MDLKTNSSLNYEKYLILDNKKDLKKKDKYEELKN